MSAHAGTPLSHRILRAGVAVAIAHGLFKLAGFIQTWAMAHYLPQATYDAVYAVAFEGVIFSLFLVGEESIGPACLPVFMRELDTLGERAAWRFANALLTLQTLLLVLAVSALMLFPEWITQFWTQWSASHKPESLALGARSVRALGPALVGLSLGSTTYVLLNAYKRFFLAAFGDAIWKFAVVGALAAGIGAWHRGAETLVWGIVGGSVLKLLTHLVGLRDKLRLLRPCFAFSNPALRRMLWLVAPLLAGIVFAKIRDNINNVYLLSALDSEGLLQANSLGRKLQGTIHFMVPYALSIAVFPFFCEFADKRDQQRLGAFVTRSGRLLLACFVPFSVVIAVLALPLTGFLFAGGRFDALAVHRTAVSMSLYTLVLPAAAIEALVMQAFFANRRMVAIAIAGIVFSTLSIAVSWLGLHLWADREILVLAAIAGGMALSRTLKSWCLVWLLGRHTPAFPLLPTLGFLGRLALVTLAAGGAAWLGARVSAGVPAIAHHGRLTDLAQLAAGGTAALAAGALACLLVRLREPLDLLKLARLPRYSRYTWQPPDPAAGG
ncbi:MAG: lipid II flippase MurJ [Kiritimatiellae bacterium]|nr:lipid II flippase MurJ [Kiritimatiellia bacterium]